MSITARWVGVTQDQVINLNRRCKQMWDDWEDYPDPINFREWSGQGRTSCLDTWFSLGVLSWDNHEIMMHLPNRKTLAELDVVRWMGVPEMIIDHREGTERPYPFHPLLMRKPSWFKRLINFFKRT